MTATDGRRRRTERTRAAIVDALLGAIRAGEGVPASEEIARRAGVTQRTLFHHFDDVPSLVQVVVDVQVRRFRTLLPHPARSGTLAARVAAYVDALTPSMDELAAVRWTVLSYKDARPELAAGLRRVRSLTRRRLAVVVAPELRARDVPGRKQLLDALEAASDPITWRLLRDQIGLSVPAAARHVTAALVALARGVG